MSADLRRERRDPVNSSIRYSVLCFAVFFTPGVVQPFLPLFLAHQGFDAAAIGLLLAVGGPARIVVGPLLLWLIDLGVPARFVLAITHTGAAALMMLSVAVGSFWPMAALLTGFFLLNGTSGTIVDASVLRAARRDERIAYGRIRAWGSVGFVVANLAAGFLIARFSPVAAVWMIVVSVISTGLIAQFVRGDDGQRQTATADGPKISIPVGALAAVILASAAIQTTHAGYYAVGSIHWKALGYSGDTIGLLWAAGVIAEVILLMRLGVLAKTIETALAMLTLATIVAMARFIAMSFDPPLWLTFLLQFSHAVTFGLTLFAAMAALSLLSPYNWRGRVQGFHAATVSLFMSVGMYLAGHAYENHGASTFAYFSGVGIVALLCIAEAWRRTRRQPQSDGSGG